MTPAPAWPFAQTFSARGFSDALLYVVACAVGLNLFWPYLRKSIADLDGKTVENPFAFTLRESASEYYPLANHMCASQKPDELAKGFATR